MRCAVVFSNLVNRAWERYSIGQYIAEQLYTMNVKYLAPGTYTLTAETDPDPDVGKGITCYAQGEKNDGTVWTYPATGESVLPMTFTVSEVSDVRFFFGYEGFRDVMPGEGNEIAQSAISAVKCGDPNTPDRDIYESAIMPPDEISDSCALAQGISAKSSVTLRIFPDFESWGFCRRSITLVRIIDLERAEDRTIFKGRVSAISDIMENGGAVRQDVICVSAADFLEDTSFANGIEPQSLTTWLGTRCAAHNNQVELARRYTFTVGGTAAVSSGTEYLCKTNFEILNEVLTGEKYLRENGEIVKYEWRERYHNDIVYIDTAAKIGTDMDTPFEIGDNLTSITVTQDINGGIYTSVFVISGVNSDGCRATATAANGAMIARYGNGRQLVIVNDDIYFTGPGGREYTSGGGWNWHVTPAVAAMETALQAYANQEAAKLSEPPIRITLTASDLAQMGFSGYEPFEVGNSHPLVYPPGGYFGQRVRITGIRRRLSDGRIEQITIAQGQQPGKRSGGTISAQMAKLAVANTAATDERKIVEIADQKVETQTDGIKTLRVTRARYDSIQHDPDTLYIIDDEGDKSMALGNDPIMREGGGGGTIETAAVLSSEQMVYWAPAHELVPVWFRGNAAVYYGQAPAKMVIQGQRANFGSPAITNEDIMSEIALDFRDGTRQKLKIYIHRLSLSSMQLGVICYDISGASEALVGAAASSYEFAVSGGTVQIGMILTVSELYANEDLDLAPRYGVMLAVKTGDTVQTASLPAIGASKFTGSNVNFSDDAERGFASGIARYTEPGGG